MALTVVTFSETVSVNMDYLVNKHPKIETVKKETKATTKNTQSKAVKTGDNTNITLYTSLLIISVIVVAGTIVLRKKKS